MSLARRRACQACYQDRKRCKAPDDGGSCERCARLGKACVRAREPWAKDSPGTPRNDQLNTSWPEAQASIPDKIAQAHPLSILNASGDAVSHVMAARGMATLMRELGQTQPPIFLYWLCRSLATEGVSNSSVSALHAASALAMENKLPNSALVAVLTSALEASQLQACDAAVSASVASGPPVASFVECSQGGKRCVQASALYLSLFSAANLVDAAGALQGRTKCPLALRGWLPYVQIQPHAFEGLLDQFAKSALFAVPQGNPLRLDFGASEPVAVNDMVGNEYSATLCLRGMYFMDGVVAYHIVTFQDLVLVRGVMQPGQQQGAVATSRGSSGEILQQDRQPRSPQLAQGGALAVAPHATPPQTPLMLSTQASSQLSTQARATLLQLQSQLRPDQPQPTFQPQQQLQPQLFQLPSAAFLQPAKLPQQH